MSEARLYPGAIRLKVHLFIARQRPLAVRARSCLIDGGAGQAGDVVLPAFPVAFGEGSDVYTDQKFVTIHRLIRDFYLAAGLGVVRKIHIQAETALVEGPP